MNTTLIKNICFLLGFFAHYAFVLVCCLPYWKVSNWQSSDGLYGRIPAFDGVWWHCMSLKTGGFSCNNYGKPLIYSTTDIQACRALMCIATIFSFFGVIISLLSLDCTRFIEPETKGKNLSAMTAGICYIIAALTCGIAVSWFAWKITYEYYSPYFQQAEFKFEFGACLYIGWIATLFALISGLVLLIGSCRKLKDRTDEYKPPKQFVYKPPTNSFVKPSGEKAEYV